MPTRSQRAQLWDHQISEDMRKDGLICRHARTPASYASGLHRHVGVGIVFCASGQGTFFLGDQALPYSSGSLVVFNSEVPHRVNVDSTYERWDLCVWPEITAELMQNDTFAGLVARFHIGERQLRAYNIPVSEHRRLNRLFYDVQREARRRGPGFDLYVRCKLIELFIVLDRVAAATTPAEASTGTDAVMADMISYIDQRMADNLTVEQLAKAFHYNPSHLYRIVRSATGQTPSHLIKTRKIDRAKRLLLTTHLTVTAVAAAVGTPSTSHFCKTFRDETGMTPQQYRHNNR